MRGLGAKNPSPQNINMSLRPAIYVSRNTETRCSRNHYCHAKAKRIIYYVCVCVFVTLGIQHAMRMCYIVICGLCGSTIFSHVISQTALFLEKKSYCIKSGCFFLYNFRQKHFAFWEEFSEVWWKMYIGLHVKHPLLLSDFNLAWIF
jgi:hypothetical protein